MDRRDAFFLLVVFAGGGYFVHEHWEEIAQKVGLDDLNPGRIKAIELAKQQFTFDRYRQNGVIIHERLHGKQIEAAEEPWTAARLRTNRFLVVCSYREEGQAHFHQFKVDIGSGQVEDAGDSPTPPVAPSPLR